MYIARNTFACVGKQNCADWLAELHAIYPQRNVFVCRHDADVHKYAATADVMLQSRSRTDRYAELAAEVLYDCHVERLQGNTNWHCA